MQRGSLASRRLAGGSPLRVASNYLCRQGPLKGPGGHLMAALLPEYGQPALHYRVSGVFVSQRPLSNEHVCAYAHTCVYYEYNYVVVVRIASARAISKPCAHARAPERDIVRK